MGPSKGAYTHAFYPADVYGCVPGPGTVLTAGTHQVLNIFQPSLGKEEGKEGAWRRGVKVPVSPEIFLDSAGVSFEM